MAYSFEFKRHCYRLCAEGLSPKDVSDIEGPSVSSIYIWRREFELREEIAFLSSLLRDVLDKAIKTKKDKNAKVKKLKKKIKEMKNQLKKCA